MRRAWAVIGLGALMLLAACSDDDDATSTTTEATTTTAVGTTTSTSAAAATTTSDSAATTAAPATTAPPSTPPPSFTGPASEELCATVRELNEREATITAGFAGDSTPNMVRQAFDDVRGLYDEVVAGAPPEIEADVDTLAAAFRSLRDVYDEFDYDAARMLAAAQGDAVLAARLAVQDEPDVLQARDRFAAFALQVCGIRPAGA